MAQSLEEPVADGDVGIRMARHSTGTAPRDLPLRRVKSPTRPMYELTRVHSSACGAGAFVVVATLAGSPARTSGEILPVFALLLGLSPMHVVLNS